MKTFRIGWYAVVEDESVLEGRSLITAESYEQAVEELVSMKVVEYRLKPNMVKIHSIVEIQRDL